MKFLPSETQCHPPPPPPPLNTHRLQQRPSSYVSEIPVCLCVSLADQQPLNKRPNLKGTIVTNNFMNTLFPWIGRLLATLDNHSLYYIHM